MVISSPPCSTLFPYTTLFRSSRHALGIYCLLLIGFVSVRAVLSFYTRWILIGVSRDIEFDIRGDLLNRLLLLEPELDRKSTRLNSSHPSISYAVFCLKKKQTI